MKTAILIAAAVAPVMELNPQPINTKPMDVNKLDAKFKEQQRRAASRFNMEAFESTMEDRRNGPERIYSEYKHKDYGLADGLMSIIKQDRDFAAFMAPNSKARREGQEKIAA